MTTTYPTVNPRIEGPLAALLETRFHISRRWRPPSLTELPGVSRIDILDSAVRLNFQPDAANDQRQAAIDTVSRRLWASHLER
jgi:hypothetical protein